MGFDVAPRTVKVWGGEESVWREMQERCNHNAWGSEEEEEEEEEEDEEDDEEEEDEEDEMYDGSMNHDDDATVDIRNRK